MSNNKHHHVPGHPTVGHVSPIPQLLLVFGALIALTILTVALSGKLPGAEGMLVAMGIATVKALLVALYFMHLRYDRPFHGYVFLASIMFVACFFGITSLDSAAYRKDIDPYEKAYYQNAEEAFPRHKAGESLHPAAAADSEAEPGTAPDAGGH
jgi:cytochrome c oxidase subunit 4